MKRLNSWGNSRHFRCRWMLLAGLALIGLDLVACNLNPQPEPPLGVPTSTGGPTAATGGTSNPGTAETGGTAGVGGDVALGMDNGGAGAVNASGGGFSAAGASGMSSNPPPVYPTADASAPVPNGRDAGVDGGDAQ